MKRLEAVTGHTRLFRRGAVYYHRAAIPQDIKDTYPKTEEVFSLRTKDYAEALRRVRVAAVEVDKRFAEHRRRIEFERSLTQQDLSAEQISDAKAAYYRHLLEEDEESRLEGFLDLDERGVVIGPLPETPRRTFEEHGESVSDWKDATRFQYARGKSDAFWNDEADEVLSWRDIGLRLSPSSASRPRLIRALQEAVIEAAESIGRRQQGDIVPTPVGPSSALMEAPAAAPLLSEKVAEWIAEKSRADWSVKAQADYRLNRAGFAGGSNS